MVLEGGKDIKEDTAGQTRCHQTILYEQRQHAEDDCDNYFSNIIFRHIFCSNNITLILLT